MIAANAAKPLRLIKESVAILETCRVCTARAWVCVPDEGHRVASAEQTVDSILSASVNRRSINTSALVAQLSRVASGLEALADRLARVGQEHGACGTINENRDYSRAETARVLGVSQRTVDRRVRDGALRAIKKGNTVRIDGASLRQFRGGVMDAGTRSVLRL